MPRFNKVIFLDEDNTRLSPITEVLFRQKMEEQGKTGIFVCSRGNVVLFPEPVNQKIAKIAAGYGFDLSGYSAKELTDTDLTSKTLTLTMDAAGKAAVYEKFSGAANIYTLKEYLGSAGDLKLPLGGSIDEYATIIEIISGLLDVLLDKLFEENGN